MFLQCRIEATKAVMQPPAAGAARVEIIRNVNRYNGPAGVGGCVQCQVVVKAQIPAKPDDYGGHRGLEVSVETIVYAIKSCRLVRECNKAFQAVGRFRMASYSRFSKYGAGA